MKNDGIERVRNIIKFAYKLGWITPVRSGKSYPEMQLSEVEKCMVAMYDDYEFGRMERWYNEKIKEGGTKTR